MVVAGHARSGCQQPVDIDALEYLSQRIDQACEAYVAVYLYVFIHNKPAGMTPASSRESQLGRQGGDDPAAPGRGAH